MFNDVTTFGNTYTETLAFGLGVEERYAAYMQKQGYTYFNTAWAINPDKGNGPKMDTPDGSEIIMPDLWLGRGEDRYWAEVKAKTGLTLYRRTGKFQTGVDKKNFEHYQQFQEIKGEEVRIIHISGGKATKDSPATSPVILMASLDTLAQTIDHVGGEYRNGRYVEMLYWDVKVFERVGEGIDAVCILHGVPWPDPNCLDLF